MGRFGIDGATKSTPIDLPGLDDANLSYIVYIPADIELHEVGAIPNPNGLCVKKDETFQAHFVGGLDGSSDCFNLIPDVVTEWQGRRVKRDGTFEAWSALHNASDVARSADETIVANTPGCFQVRMLMTLSDASTIEFPLLRKQNARSFVNGQGTPNIVLLTGELDYFGVAKGRNAKAVRGNAVSWLGSTQYSTKAEMIMNPDPGPQAVNPSTQNSSKCNIFVTHIVNQSDDGSCPADYWVRPALWNNKWAAPLATEDWFTDPSEHSFLVNWPPTAIDAFPAPGMVEATNRQAGVNAGSGHVGIVDYDGTWINAGGETVNKYISQGDVKYSPVNLRSSE